MSSEGLVSMGFPGLMTTSEALSMTQILLSGIFVYFAQITGE